jgi:N-acetylmuramic acid 6-phosphate (MurNAc-6-P) etherase
VDRERARETLKESGSLPVALIMLKAGVSRIEAKRRLKAAGGHVRRAIELSGSAKPSVSKTSPQVR